MFTGMYVSSSLLETCRNRHRSGQPSWAQVQFRIKNMMQLSIQKVVCFSTYSPDNGQEAQKAVEQVSGEQSACSLRTIQKRLFVRLLYSVPKCIRVWCGAMHLLQQWVA